LVLHQPLGIIRMIYALLFTNQKITISGGIMSIEKPDGLDMIINWGETKNRHEVATFCLFDGFYADNTANEETLYRLADWENEDLAYVDTVYINRVLSYCKTLESDEVVRLWMSYTNHAGFEL
jgi:hypothetical protein